MLYDLGKIDMVKEWKARLLLASIVAGTVAAICVSLAVAVRIGNLIIGW